MGKRTFICSREKLDELYVDKNLSMATIATLHGVTRLCVRNHLLKHSIPIRNRNGQYGDKPTYDENVFQKWTPEMAWMLGYISADGCLRPKRYELKFKSIDYDMLEFVRHWFRSNQPIKSEKNSNCYTFYIYSKSIITALEAMGIHHRKTFTIMPAPVPDKFFWDYLGGLIDGDGHIRIYPDTSARVSVSLLGNSLFIEAISNRIASLLESSPQKPNKRGKIVDLVYCGDSAETILRNVYLTNTFRLPRKKTTALRSLDKRHRLIHNVDAYKKGRLLTKS